MWKSSSDRGRPNLPPEEERCVWMTAGILSYGLCERAFDCEHCHLDAALRQHFTPAGPMLEPLPAAQVAASRLDEGRRYSRGHCWVEVRAEAESGRVAARVGLEPTLAAALQTPRTVVPPRPGEHVDHGATHLWLVSEGGTFPLAAPVSGTIRRLNPALAERPHLAAARPLDDGWLYELELDDPGDLEDLLDHRGAERAYARDARRLRSELLRALRSASPEVPSLADGGVPVGSMSEMLGASRYFSLLRLVYG